MKAAEAGHLHLLKYVRERGCPWDEGTAAYAIIEGNRDIFLWARANGCPGFRSRAQVRHWLEENDPEDDPTDEFNNESYYEDIVEEYDLDDDEYFFDDF